MNDTSFGGGWMFVLVILVVLFGGWGGFGGNANAAAYATMADVNSAISNQSLMQGINAVQLSSQNNNYETAQLISGQNLSMMQQSNTALLTAVNGFNALSSNIASGFNSVNQNIADLGFKMEKCCCDIKTQMLEQRLQDTQFALQNAQNVATTQAQSEFLLSQLGSYTPGVLYSGK